MAAMPRIASQIIASRLRPMGSAEEEGMLKPLVVVVVGEAEVVVAIFFFFSFHGSVGFGAMTGGKSCLLVLRRWC